MPNDFETRFNDLLNMKIPEWNISPFDVELQNANLDTFLKEEFIEMNFDLEARLMEISKRIGHH